MRILDEVTRCHDVAQVREVKDLNTVMIAAAVGDDERVVLVRLDLAPARHRGPGGAGQVAEVARMRAIGDVDERRAIGAARAMRCRGR